MSTTTSTPKKRTIFNNPRYRHEALNAYLFLSPYLLVTSIFTIGIILFAFYTSFTKFNLFTWPPTWVGLENYAKALTLKGKFVHSLVNVLWYVVIVVPSQTVLALLLAMMVNVKVRGSQFFRTVFYAPSVTSSVVITMIFWWLYLKTGYLNYGLTKLWAAFGREWVTVEWLNNPHGLIQLIVGLFGVDVPSKFWYLRGPSVTWMAIMFQNIFTTAPTFMIMFLAALQDIPPSLYEAASIDGANGRQKFLRITIPMMRPVIMLIIVLGTIGTWQIFDQVKILTAGGPLNTTLVPVYLIYSEGLGTSGPPQMGYASAMAFILAVIIFIFTYFQRRLIESGTEQY
ncbi:MAG TPA: sugar ABC transporter permease [Anaerolineae bacterium]|nr:sugar ABC transporter permease [Anaerolineae bacterium]